MKRYRVVVAAPAEAEIEQAYLYIHEDSPANAAKWRAGLLTAAGSLATAPERCSLAPENGAWEIEIRHFIYGSYRMLFAIDGDDVVILHVRHGARRAMTPDEIVPPSRS